MSKRSSFLGVCFAMAGLLLAATVGFGATWYVATDGDNGDSGSQAEPFRTIQYAVDQAADGDTIMVEAGTYSGDITISKNGLDLNSVDGAATTIIDGGTIVIELTGNGLAVDGFRIENADFGIRVMSAQSADVTVSSCWIDHIALDGIDFTQDILGCSVTVENSTIAADRYGIDLGVHMGESDQPVAVRIANNTVEGASSYGIYFDRFYSGSAEVSGNSLLDCGSSAIYVEETGYDGKEISFKIEDNRVTLSKGVSGSYYGIYVYSCERETWVSGNEVTGDYRGGIYLGNVGIHGMGPVLLHVEDNLVSGCRENGIYADEVFCNFSGSVNIRGNVVSDAGMSGVYINDLGDGEDVDDFRFTFEDNIIFECAYGLSFEDIFGHAAGSAYIRGNNFLNNWRGLAVVSVGERFGDSTLVIENNNFDGNSGYGLYNGTLELIDAASNWWGDESGPKDAKILPGTPNYNNPDGLGNEVSEYVDYAGWLEEPYVADSDSSSGCSVGGFSPAMLLLVLPLAGLFRRVK